MDDKMNKLKITILLLLILTISGCYTKVEPKEKPKVEPKVEPKKDSTIYTA